MKVITFFADCILPKRPHQKQAGFDWRWAIGQLSRTAALHGMETMTVTDQSTKIDAWLRTGNAKEQGIMQWLLEAQAEAIKASIGQQIVMISPDTLIAKPLDVLVGDWDLCLLTRERPKPIVNSVIACRASEQLYSLWLRIAEHAKTLSAGSREWGADIDAVVEVLDIKFMEDGIREHDGIRLKLTPTGRIFKSAVPRLQIQPIKAHLWDFKGDRKKMMPMYAKLL